jgi:hypothetical protein
MSRYTVNEISEIIEEESLSYAILDAGISPSRIKDPELAALWEEARDVLIRIQEHIDLHAGDDDDDDDIFNEDEF